MTIDLEPAPAPIAPAAARPRIFSGIQPSGAPHIGNDLGAIRNYVKLQWEYEAIYCIVDYHALTSLHDPERLRTQTREMAAALLALGLDPERCTLFVQSHRPEHTELAWLLMTVTPVSWLERTPTYKEKRENQPEDINHGLLTYPVLQAADIVIYKASLVPVGKDQAAHLELSREIVRAFNRTYGETFPEPQAVHTEAPIVLGTDGVRKMSKSLGNIVTIEQALNKWGMNTLRLYSLSVHYAKPLDYTDDLLKESAQRWRQIETCAYELRSAVGGGGEADAAHHPRPQQRSLSLRAPHDGAATADDAPALRPTRARGPVRAAAGAGVEAHAVGAQAAAAVRAAGAQRAPFRR